MKRLYRVVVRLAFNLNVLYSGLWIAITGTNKHEYREHSRVHHALVSIGFYASCAAKGLDVRYIRSICKSEAA